ncbi:MAG: 3-oxoacyl-[acyl-carrier-protein] reductase [Magnetococcales bacterium]|nr:3-oxoacyl-[acyl-carrier-protein] reductase [Magnetococcales bacterium]NGZ26945.1 3-oxoacyl-[acyl-carrier-protein] reductase [Magnetococcales bacterium]
MAEYEQDLKDRVAIVTGSSSGIGRVTALELAKRGAKVMITSNESKRILDTLEEVRQFSPESESLEADVTSPPCMEEVVAYTMRCYNRIDILVNNAGITRDNLLIRMSDQEWYKVMEVNLTSVFRMTRLVARPMMKQRYGRIVNITSVVGFTGNPGQANYTATKAGVVAFTKTVARELAGRNITANCVAPGFIATPMTDKLKPEAQNAILSQIPLARPGTAEDVAQAVAFLVSDRASYITGETLHVNGGMYMG